ncbi:MAG: hypothetical protein KFB93_05490 [Simkaniaceae bacterium]|nr:MAG: hypothetical protein KFB93_05490 [Simkaniaceae bacterium]
MTHTIEKRRLIDLALEAGRRYLSPKTDLIHYCYEDERSTDTIPLFENLCYILTLFRTLVGDHVQEGKERLKHLFAFRMDDGRFPVYLHQYPKGRGSYRTMYPLFLIDQYFHKVIEEPLRSEIRKNLTLPLPPLEITNSKEAGMMALHLMCHGYNLDTLAPFWDFNRQFYLGPLSEERQRKGEIETTLFDLFMGHSPRILKPHPIHLHASLVFPHENGAEAPPPIAGYPKPVGKGFHLYRKVWEEGDHLHTLVCQDKNILQKENIFTYPEMIPDEKNRMELTFYTDRAEGKTVLINGEKGTVFKLGDLLSIVTPVETLNFTFKLIEGEGDFLGHLSFGNRPAQLETHDFTAYDWKIGIRSLRRTPTLKLHLQEL